MTLFGVSHLGNRVKSVQEPLLILISLVAPYAPKVPTLRQKIALKTPVYKECSKTQIASGARESTQFCNRFYIKIHLLSVSSFTEKKFKTKQHFHQQREESRLSDTTFFPVAIRCMMM